MRKIFILSLLIVFGAVGGFAQTKNKPTKSKVKTKQKAVKSKPAKGAEMANGATLTIKQKENIKSGDLTIEFVAVLEDSRCPEGVNCIWAGNAKVQIKVSKNGAATETIELNTNLQPRTVNYQGYTITLAGVNPYPKDGVKTAGYAVSLSVEKQ